MNSHTAPVLSYCSLEPDFKITLLQGLQERPFSNIHMTEPETPDQLSSPLLRLEVCRIRPWPDAVLPNGSPEVYSCPCNCRSHVRPGHAFRIHLIDMASRTVKQLIDHRPLGGPAPVRGLCRVTSDQAGPTWQGASITGFHRNPIHALFLA